MTHLYDVAAGTVTGRAHLLAGRNGQDAFALERSRDAAVAVVCDGCGGEPRSEIGAVLGAKIAARALARHRDLALVRREMLDGVAHVAEAAGADVRECLLFTVVAAVLRPEGALVVACGDGVVAVDGAVRTIGPYAAPPYVAYGGAWEVLHDGPASTVLVGTDGAADLPSLDAFWSDERVFRNPDMVRRRLWLSRPADDATVAVVRRRTP
jgi:hypothetical protein